MNVQLQWMAIHNLDDPRQVGSVGGESILTEILVPLKAC